MPLAIQYASHLPRKSPNNVPVDKTFRHGGIECDSYSLWNRNIRHVLTKFDLKGTSFTHKPTHNFNMHYLALYQYPEYGTCRNCGLHPHSSAMFFLCKSSKKFSHHYTYDLICQLWHYLINRFFFNLAKRYRIYSIENLELWHVWRGIIIEQKSMMQHMRFSYAWSGVNLACLVRLLDVYHNCRWL